MQKDAAALEAKKSEGRLSSKLQRRVLRKVKLLESMFSHYVDSPP
jgi:hypothetical protein